MKQEENDKKIKLNATFRLKSARKNPDGTWRVKFDMSETDFQTLLKESYQDTTDTNILQDFGETYIDRDGAWRRKV